MRFIFMFTLFLMTSLVTAAHAQEYKTTILAGGCFWCVESDFKKLDGVIDAVSGYAGGDRKNPTYKNYNKLDNSSLKTPHIEVVQITYDPAKLNYRDILEYHVRHIDPTDGDGQFCDRGAGYRPAIFVKNDDERATAQSVLAETSVILDQDIDVDILDDAPFWAAEDYHQDYASKNPTRYKFYRWNCGRDQRVKDIWNGK